MLGQPARFDARCDCFKDDREMTHVAGIAAGYIFLSHEDNFFKKGWSRSRGERYERRRGEEEEEGRICSEGYGWIARGAQNMMHWWITAAVQVM
jgi:hypothetical protein